MDDHPTQVKWKWEAAQQQPAPVQGPILCAECGGTELEPVGLCGGVLHPPGADQAVPVEETPRVPFKVVESPHMPPGEALAISVVEGPDGKPQVSAVRMTGIGSEETPRPAPRETGKEGPLCLQCEGHGTCPTERDFHTVVECPFFSAAPPRDEETGK